MPTETFNTAGSHTYDVPGGASELLIECWGAEGADGTANADEGSGGNGGYIRAIVPASEISESTLTVEVGGAGSGSSGGHNGGGDGGSVNGQQGGGGGGASDVRDGSALADRLVVAAGGGGGAAAWTDGGVQTASGGGHGGGDTGQSGGLAEGGGGGSQSSGGSAGSGIGDNTDGALGEGGIGDEFQAFSSTGDFYGGSGGGGSGYYGGGGGGGDGPDNTTAGGGGGSNFAIGGATIEQNDRGGNAGGGQVTITTVPAPTNATVTDERDSELDVGWDAADGNPDYTVYRHDSSNPYANGQAVATVSQASYTDTGLTNGKQYHYQVTTLESGEESDPSVEATGSTLLPSPSIDATDPYDDSIELGYSLSDDNPDGHVDVLRSTDGSMGGEVGTVSDLSQTEFADTDVASDQTYHYTLRRDTGDVTAYSSQIEGTATFRPIVDLQADTVAEQSIGPGWDSDSAWSGSIEVWRDRVGYDYTDPKGEQIDTLDASARSYSDTGLHPNTTYTYTLVAIADVGSSTESDTTTATTTGADLPKTRTRRAEWTAEIRLDDRTLRPPIVGEADVQPRANDLPKIRLPTTDGPWTRLDLEDGPEELLVWYEGVRQPIEELERIEEADDGHVLVGRGGTSLLDRVQIEVDQQPVHDLAQELIEDHTPYAPVVDAPPEALSEEVIFDVTSASAWSNLFANTDLSRIPVGVDDSTDELYSQQSNWVREAESPDHEAGISSGDFDELADYSGPSDQGTGGAYLLDSTNDALEYEFETEYTIPAEALNVRTRWRDGDDVELTVSIDDNTFCVVPTNYTSSLLWGDPKSTSIIDVVWSTDLEPGTHTLRYEVTDTGGNVEPHVLDVVSVGDDRYDYNYDDDVTAYEDGNYLEGPESYPEITVETDVGALVLSAVAAELTTVWDDTSGVQKIQVSNDGGSSWLPADGSEENTESVSHGFAPPGAQLQARLRFGRHGSRESTPATGFNGQRVSSLELTATLDDTPIAVNQQWDTSARAILRDLAEQAGAIWDVERNDGIEINWTFPGVREATVTEPLTTYDQATDVRERASSVVVVGSNAQQVGDRIEADHGTELSLQQANLVSGSEAVYDPDTGDSYQRDDDYEMDYSGGEITTLSAGDIGSGQTVAVDYRYETRGRFETGSSTSDREITRNITGLVSDRQCSIAARRIALELSEPLHEAEVGFTPGPKSWSIVDQLTVDALPFPGPYTPRETRTQNGEVRARLGSRQSVEEIVSEIKDQSDRVARRE